MDILQILGFIDPIRSPRGESDEESDAGLPGGVADRSDGGDSMVPAFADQIIVEVHEITA